MKSKLLTGLLLFYIAGLAQQQKPAFWNDIQAFKKQDSINFPAPNQILLVGSSSFTKWKDVQEYFPGYPIINRGFGGSILPDVIRYVNDIIIPYRPRQVVIYCGENDFAISDTITVRTVVNRFKDLFHRIRYAYPRVDIAFISFKPSPNRRRLMPKLLAANNEIKSFLATEQQTAFINVYDKMLKPDGEPMDHIFLQDSLHMNAKGYAIWQKEIEPFLLKNSSQPHIPGTG